MKIDYNCIFDLVFLIFEKNSYFNNIAKERNLRWLTIIFMKIVKFYQEEYIQKIVNRMHKDGSTWKHTACRSCSTIFIEHDNYYS